MRVVKEAKPFPVSGVYSYNDLPDEAPINPVTTGWSSVNRYIMP